MNSFRNMFTDATSFVGGDLGGWKTSRVTNMLGMFLGCDEFNGNVSTWDVSRVVTFETTFEYCPRWVVGDLSQWKPSGALNMVKMFKDAHAFNSNLSAWNVSRVTDMTEMVRRQSVFRDGVD